MGALLGWFPTQAEYDALALYELDEIRHVMKEKAGR